MQRFFKSARSYLMMFAIPLALFVIMLLAFDEITLGNVPSLFKQAIFPTVLSCGLMFNFACGNWDLAIGAEAVLSAILAGNLAVNTGLGLPGIIIGCVVVGACCGAITGTIFYITKVPTIIVTVGLLFIYECIGSLVSGGSGINISNTDYVVLGVYPWNIIYGAVGMIAAYFILYRTKLGYRMRAVGNDANIAQANGINTTLIKAVCLMISGAFAGFYSAASLCSTGITAATTQMGTLSIAFDAMMSYLVGKAISFGRNNLVISMFAGALVMQLVKLLLLVMSIPTSYVNACIAILILLLMALIGNSQVFSRIKNHLSRKETNA